MNIAIVVSRFNEDITGNLLKGAKQRLLELGISEAQLEIAWVPGAVELPLIAAQFAKQQRFAAIICLGVVIRGETDHYDYVCQQASMGCQEVSLRHNIPVMFGVLTTHSRSQAMARAGGERGNKGAYCADAAVDMAQLMAKLKAVNIDE